jgi:outer membrane lipoprotein carrier protein
MKFSVSALCLLMISSVAGAAETAAEQLKYKLARLNTYQASFQQTVTDATNKQVQTGEGSLSLKQPALFRFETLSPSPNLLIGDGKTLWHYDPVLEEVKIYDASKEVDKTPFVLLTSSDAKLWALYTVTGKGEEFVIVPKDKNSPVQRLTLQFSGVDLAKMAVASQDGQTSSFEFIAMQSNVNIDTSQFVFSAPADVQIDTVDLRGK